jgi:hypothetical protein
MNCPTSNKSTPRVLQEIRRIVFVYLHDDFKNEEHFPVSPASVKLNKYNKSGV